MFKKVFSSAIAITALTIGSAHGAPITLDSVSGIWTAASPVSVSGVGSSKIEWGNPASGGTSKSGYEFVGAAPPAVSVNTGVAFDLGTFTHFNFPITGDSLDTATLEVTSDLTIDGSSQSVLSVFDFLHLETPNNANPCADGNSNGSGVNENGCADKVTFALNAGASDEFTIGGVDYQLDISGFLFGGSLASTFWTTESEANTADLRGIITTSAKVPEPATLTLLGLGLLGLGLRRAKA